MDPGDELKALKLVSNLNTSQNLHASQELKKEFLNRYYLLTKMNKSEYLQISCPAVAPVAESGNDDWVEERLF